MALRALPESMAGAIHFVALSKPPQIGQFWCLHVSKFPTRGIRLPDPVDYSQQLLPHLAIVDETNGDYALVIRYGTASRTQRRGDFEREGIVDVISLSHLLQCRRCQAILEHTNPSNPRNAPFFALVEKVPCLTKARSQSGSGLELSPPHPSLRSHRDS